MSKKIVLTKVQIDEVETLGACLTTEQLADYFGIARRTMYDIFDREPEIHARYKKGKAKAIESIAGSLITKARGGDTASQIFFLKTQAGWREQDKSQEGTKAQDLIDALSLLSKSLPS